MSGKVKSTKFSVLPWQHHLSWWCHNCLGNFVWQQNSSYAGRSFVTCYYSFKFPLNSHSLHSPAICSSYFWPQKELFWLVCVLHNNENLTLVSSNGTGSSLEDNRLFSSAFCWIQGVHRKQKIEINPHILTARLLNMSHFQS